MIDVKGSLRMLDIDVIKHRHEELKNRAIKPIVKGGRLTWKMSKEEMKQKVDEWDELLALEKELLRRSFK